MVQHGSRYAPQPSGSRVLGWTSALVPLRPCQGLSLFERLFRRQLLRPQPAALDVIPVEIDARPAVSEAHLERAAVRDDLVLDDANSIVHCRSAKPHATRDARHRGINRVRPFKTGRSKCDCDDKQKNTRENNGKELNVKLIALRSFHGVPNRSGPSQLR
jgi:hypothetical protein